MSNIPTKDDTKEEIRSLGSKGETYDEILKKLVDCYKKQNKKKTKK